MRANGELGTANLVALIVAGIAFVFGGAGELVTNTSHYSYKPNQSGSAVDFQCLSGAGAYAANWLAIALVALIRRRAR